MRLAHLLFSIAVAPLAFGANYLMYVGTYTSANNGSKGIYVYRFDSATGQVSGGEVAGETQNPSFVAIHPNHKNLYAVGELYGGNREGEGAVSAFSIDAASGKLKFLNTVSAKGGGPCHLNVDKTGRNLLVANYGTGSTALFRIKDDGSLEESKSFIQHSGSSANKQRQQGPHAHSVNISPDNRFAVVADLGTDQVNVYKLDAAAGTIALNNPPFTKVQPGGGPRHFTFHPKGKYAYVINEIGNTVTAFKYNAKKGVLTEKQTISTIPADYKETTHTAEVVAHPSGKFLYGSNRGHDSIAVFRIKGGGKLELVEVTKTGGRTPRNFVVDPSGGFLLAENQATNDIVVFRIDRKTGKLTPTGQKVNVPSPVCIRFLAL